MTTYVQGEGRRQDRAIPWTASLTVLRIELTAKDSLHRATI